MFPTEADVCLELRNLRNEQNDRAKVLEEKLDRIIALLTPKPELRVDELHGRGFYVGRD